MTAKLKLYIGLLPLGLALLGGGLWFLLNPITSAPVTVPVFDVPEGEPVIIMERVFIMGGERNQLAIYEDGTVIYHKDKGLRPPPPPGESATRTWSRSLGQPDCGSSHPCNGH